MLRNTPVIYTFTYRTHLSYICNRELETAGAYGIHYYEIERTNFFALFIKLAQNSASVLTFTFFSAQPAEISAGWNFDLAAEGDRRERRRPRTARRPTPAHRSRPGWAASGLPSPLYPAQPWRKKTTWYHSKQRDLRIQHKVVFACWASNVAKEGETKPCPAFSLFLLKGQ